MFSSAWWSVLTASLLACLVTTIGIFVINKFEDWGKANVVYFMSFAAGMLISVSFLHIIPESFSMNSDASAFLLAGFLALYLINRFLNTVVCHEYDSTSCSLGLIPMLGIGFHSFIDGVIYSVAFNVSVFTGILTVLGMILHEFPEEIVTFLLLDQGGFSRKRSTWYAILSAAVSTPLGTILSFPFISAIKGQAGCLTGSFIRRPSLRWRLTPAASGGKRRETLFHHHVGGRCPGRRDDRDDQRMTAHEGYKKHRGEQQLSGGCKKEHDNQSKAVRSASNLHNKGGERQW